MDAKWLFVDAKQTVATWTAATKTCVPATMMSAAEYAAAVVKAHVKSAPRAID